MLTLTIALFAVILLTHFFADVIKAALVVMAVLGVFYLVRDVSFSALANEGARALYNATGELHSRCERPAPHRFVGRRI